MDKHNFEPGKIDKCQICNSINLIEVMKLGDQPLANSLIKDISDENLVQKYPVNIIRCKDCGSYKLIISLIKKKFIIQTTLIYQELHQRLIKNKKNYLIICANH